VYRVVLDEIVRKDTGDPLSPLAQIVRGAHMDVRISFVKAGFVPHGLHQHDSEQLMVVLDGAYLMQIGDEEHLLRAGDIVLIPPGVPHGGKTILQDLLVLEAHTPLLGAAADGG
jgi:quercetin dioxygenase-like cupin family protein